MKRRHGDTGGVTVLENGAVQEKLERMERSRLARECAKLDPDFEKAMAEEGLPEELSEWPKY